MNNFSAKFFQLIKKNVKKVSRLPDARVFQCLRRQLNLLITRTKEKFDHEDERKIEEFVGSLETFPRPTKNRKFNVSENLCEILSEAESKRTSVVVCCFFSVTARGARRRRKNIMKNK